MTQPPAHRGMADLGSDGEVAGLHTGQQHKDQPETERRLIRPRCMRLGGLGPEWRHRQINSEGRCDHSAPERDFRC